MSLDQAKELFLKEMDEIVDETGETKDLAFARWICRNILAIDDDAKIDEAISIGGKNDYGVDIFHYEDASDRSDSYLCWAQTKFSENLDYNVTREEMESFGKTIDYLENIPSQANSVFKQKSAEFNALGGVEAPIKKRMIFAVAGKLNQQTQELIANSSWRQQVLGTIGEPEIKFEVIDLDKILDQIVIPTTQSIRIKFVDGVLNREDTITHGHSIIGYVNAKDLVTIVKRNKQLFLQNPRETLGSNTSTNKAIFSTLNDPDKKQKFWKLNNGITATCNKFTEISSDPPEYEIEDFKVVNGRQTTFSLEKNQSSLDDTVSVLMTIHESVDPEERKLISQATNTQNPIKPVDLVTTFDEMNNMVLQCKHNYKEFYFERQTRGFQSEDKATKNRVTKRRVLDKNSTARTYYAYAINPYDAMKIPDREFFSGEDPVYYNKVFRNNRKIKDLIIPHIFMQMLRSLYDKWRIEVSNGDETHLRDKGILSKNIVKYFVLRFIAETMHHLPDDDRTKIETNMLKIFRGLKKTDPIPDIFLEIAQASYENFMMCFNINKKSTWPQELIDKLNQPNYKPTEDDTPTPYDVMYQLKLKGAAFLPDLINTKNDIANQSTVDGIKLKLSSLLSVP